VRKKLGPIGAVLVLCVAVIEIIGARGTDSIAGTRESAVNGATAEVLGVYFTPPAGAAQAIVRAIDASQREVLVQAYGFTHNAIAQALVRAQARGVKVRVVLDEKSDNTNRYVLGLFEQAQVPVRHDGKHAIAHNKVMVIDESIVITGSFNFTNSAETRNAENFLILKSADLAQTYKAQWESHWGHSKD
jgi:phosphatidylserine/phosphatidylglycerophosphate/cardiolipin synthase-like enzyme